MLAGEGLSRMAGTVGAAAIGTAILGPLGMAKKGIGLAKFGGKAITGAATGATGAVSHFNRARQFRAAKQKLQSNPYLSSQSVNSALRKKYRADRKKT